MVISVHILTKNNADILEKTLSALTSFDEVLILDTGSTDATLEIARKFKNVRTLKSAMKGFGELHNQAASLAAYDWILAIDSDEIPSQALVEEIQSLKLDPNCVYSIERENFFNGKRIKCCAGWYPDWVVRLYHKHTTSFSNDGVHEKVVCHHLKVIRLKHKLKHTPYRSISDFLEKMQRYSTLFALEHEGKKKSSFWIALGRGTVSFLKNYVLKRGFLGGKEGFILSLYNAQTTYYKYLKLAELNKKI